MIAKFWNWIRRKRQIDESELSEIFGGSVVVKALEPPENGRPALLIIESPVRLSDGAICRLRERLEVYTARHGVEFMVFDGGLKVEWVA